MNRVDSMFRMNTPFLRLLLNMCNYAVLPNQGVYGKPGWRLTTYFAIQKLLFQFSNHVISLKTLLVTEINGRDQHESTDPVHTYRLMMPQSLTL